MLDIISYLILLLTIAIVFIFIKYYSIDGQEHMTVGGMGLSAGSTGSTGLASSASSASSAELSGFASNISVGSISMTKPSTDILVNKLPNSSTETSVNGLTNSSTEMLANTLTKSLPESLSGTLANLPMQETNPTPSPSPSPNLSPNPWEPLDPINNSCIYVLENFIGNLRTLYLSSAFDAYTKYDINNVNLKKILSMVFERYYKIKLPYKYTNNINTDVITYDNEPDKFEILCYSPIMNTGSNPYILNSFIRIFKSFYNKKGAHQKDNANQFTYALNSTIEHYRKNFINLL